MRGALYALLALVAFIWILSSTHRETATSTLVSATSTPVVIETPGTSAASVSRAVPFTEMGTLVFYPNNMAPIPYLIYESASGQAISKALVFSALPATDFSPWIGGRVSVTGIEDNEHVLVTQISYVGAP
jgi:hypothetical protein